MKKNALSLMLCAVTGLIANAQVTQLNNTPPFAPGPFIGWNILGGNIGLDLKTELAQPIKFYTNAGAGSLNNLRMMIDGNSGFVGLNHSNPPGIDLSKKCV